MDCIGCGAQNPPHAKFCHACGAAMSIGPVPCRACDQPNDPGARYCVHCGAPEPAKPAAAVPPGRGASRQAVGIGAGLAVLVIAGAATAWWLAGRQALEDGGSRPAVVQAPRPAEPAASAATEVLRPESAESKRAPVQEEPVEAAAAPTLPAPEPAPTPAPPRLRSEKPPATAQRHTPPPEPAPAARKPAVGGGWYAEYLAARDECRRNSGNFFSRTTCLEKTKWKYCNDGHWGEVPECPTGSTDNRP
ncbi:zinc ribbon domain-containing protein [Schlegelella sp. S2-27]|uniref:Zinc ribbon domain-containing protein n=1 Tax=Caldimonas mangrovi TaxID=2944811 RepID=A0ABT0YJM4_9BURK|nr:zinc ribbon domain-containing protein [Caldimonas mangrovi]MCM5678599.1 zinc ribbon domain-containing protein [Caldimonas mangrovi]